MKVAPRAGGLLLALSLAAACNGSVTTKGSSTDRTDGGGAANGESGGQSGSHSATGGARVGTGGASVGKGGAFGTGGVAGSGGVPNSGGTNSGGANAGGGGGISNPDGCAPTNGGVETCDGIDNDCDGLVDEPESSFGKHDGVDFTSVASCGTCSRNCLLELRQTYSPTCNPPPASGLGSTPGSCDYGTCADGYHDRDGDRANGCEYYCYWDRVGAPALDVGGPFCGIDDDCDGFVDEDVDTCHDPQNCGLCGNSCALPHANVVCTPTAPGTNCFFDEAHCEVTGCETGWADANGLPYDGCEEGPGGPPPQGPEICDGYDNDDDGQIDEAGAPPDGIDGTADPLDPTRHFGDSCGSSVGNCAPGTLACVQASAKCVGGRAPQFEVCDGVDNDCDGSTDEDPIDTSVEPSVCPGSTRCAKVGPNLFKCLPPCQPGEFPCPTGTKCGQFQLSSIPSWTMTLCN